MMESKLSCAVGLLRVQSEVVLLFKGQLQTSNLGMLFVAVKLELRVTLHLFLLK
jgi:hypothetical protein